MLTATPPTYRGETLDESLLAPMVDSTELLDDTGPLRDRLAAEGYLYLPGFHDRDAVRAGRRLICEKLAQGGAIDTDAHDLMDGVMKPGGRAPGFAGGILREMFPAGWEAIHNVLYTGRLMEFFRSLFTQDVRHYDFTWMRLVNPGPSTAIHADVVYMGRGTHELFTVWTPWGDRTTEDGQDCGGLLLLEGSNRRRDVLDGYWHSDVDAYCVNKPDQRKMRAGTNDGWIEGTAREMRDLLGGSWRSADFRMGDVVIFHCHTIHGGTDNRSNRVRLSTDTRYQRASEAADERWIGERPPSHGPSAKRGMIC
jgi:hypothetical protein